MDTCKFKWQFLLVTAVERNVSNHDWMRIDSNEVREFFFLSDSTIKAAAYVFEGFVFRAKPETCV
jgi:hypothetical protein